MITQSTIMRHLVGDWSGIAIGSLLVHVLCTQFCGCRTALAITRTNALYIQAEEDEHQSINIMPTHNFSRPSWYSEIVSIYMTTDTQTKQLEQHRNLSQTQLQQTQQTKEQVRSN